MNLYGTIGVYNRFVAHMLSCESFSFQVRNPIMYLVMPSHDEALFFQSSVWVIGIFSPHLFQKEGGV